MATASKLPVVTSLIAGKRASGSSARFEVIHPGDAQPVAIVASASADEVDQAVELAHRSFEAGEWSKRTAEQRMAVLEKLADLVEQNATTLGRLDSEDMGKPVQIAVAQAGAAAQALRDVAHSAPHVSGKVFHSSARCLSYAAHVPLGVVAAITPWNYPTNNVCDKLGPALVMGNSVVVKPSENAPRSAVLLVELAIQAGVPPGAVHVVVGEGASVGHALARHTGIALVSFTGSTATGRHIQAAAGSSNGKRVMVELGGKSPQIVFRDVASPRALAPALLNAAIENTGQLCVARTRLLVDEAVAEEVLSGLRDAVADVRFGDPRDAHTTFGPVAFRRQYEKVWTAIDSATSSDRLHVAGDIPSGSNGFYVPAMVFESSDPRSSLVREEIFGPVLAVQRFRTEEEAIALANDTRYGLAASVWTDDAARGRRVAEALRAGNIEVLTSSALDNDVRISTYSAEPMRDSGFGVEGGIEGIRAYATWKAVTLRT